jgi:1-aminocyclopropane-1-carboxylate deaminase
VAVRLPSPLTEVADDRLARAGVRLYLKRDDLISREIPDVAKMMYGIYACAERGTFAPGTTIVAVVTGQR